MKKYCKKCLTQKSYNSFHKSKNLKDGLSSFCVDCIKSETKRIKLEKQNGTYESKRRKPRLTEEEREFNKIKQKQYMKKYRQENKEAFKLNSIMWREKSKLEGIEHYGGKCQCCGELNIKFLTLEHLNGRDKTKKQRRGKDAWNQARIQGYPDIYTVLCFNCNCAKGIYGICPHKEKHDN